MWLEHVRHLVELEQVDAMLGGMRKVHHDILQQNEDMLREHVADLWQNAAVRQLLRS